MRSPSLLLPAILWMFVLVAPLTGCTPGRVEDSEDGSDSESYQEAEVVRVVDGDTIIALIDGREERLRYIGIDAPESVAPDRPDECFGEEASYENQRLVAGQTIQLEADKENRDRFDRLLRYVYVTEPDGTLEMVNLLLVEGGYAEAGVYPPNDRYQDELFEAEDAARESGLGLWGACS